MHLFYSALNAWAAGAAFPQRGASEMPVSPSTPVICSSPSLDSSEVCPSLDGETGYMVKEGG